MNIYAIIKEKYKKLDPTDKIGYAGMGVIITSAIIGYSFGIYHLMNENSERLKLSNLENTTQNSIER